MANDSEPGAMKATAEGARDGAGAWVHSSAAASAAAISALAADSAALEALGTAADALAGVLGAGGRVLAVGNGGSCAQAAHFAEELSGRYRDNRAALGAIACTDASHLTCTANDFGYEAVFERWVRGLARAGDGLVVLTTSGNSANVVAALGAAREIGMTTVGLLGGTGGACLSHCDHVLVAPGTGSDRIQEAHTLAIHLLVEGIERKLFPELY